MHFHCRASAASIGHDRDGGLGDNMIDILVNNQPGSITSWS